jgi:hypothetical protein
VRGTIATKEIDTGRISLVSNLLHLITLVANPDYSLSRYARLDVWPFLLLYGTWVYYEAAALSRGGEPKGLTSWSTAVAIMLIISHVSLLRVPPFVPHLRVHVYTCLE